MQLLQIARLKMCVDKVISTLTIADACKTTVKLFIDYDSFIAVFILGC